MFLHCQWFGKDHFDKPSSSQYKITGMFKMSFLFRARMRGICEFSSLPFMPWSSLGTCLENVLDHAYSCLPGFFFLVKQTVQDSESKHERSSWQ